MTSPKSVNIVDTVATWPRMTKVATGAHFPCPVHIVLTGRQYRSVPMIVMKKDAHVVASSAYIATRSLGFVDVTKRIVTQTADLTIASAVI